MALVVDGGGLVNKGGALGTGAACCCVKACSCGLPYPTGTVVQAVFSVEFIDGLTTCTTGTSTKTITLTWDGSQYSGSELLSDVGPVLLTAYLACFTYGGPGSFYAGVSASLMNSGCSHYAEGYPGQGGYGSEIFFKGQEINGRCVPPSGALSFDPLADNGLSPEGWGLIYSVTLSVF